MEETQRAHSPEWAVYGGLTADEEHRFLIESASNPGNWYTTVVHGDGSGTCECPSWVHNGYCGMTTREATAHLQAVGDVAQLVLELVGMAYQLQLKIQVDGSYKLSDEEAYHARRLTRQADTILEKLGTQGAAGLGPAGGLEGR